MNEASDQPGSSVPPVFGLWTLRMLALAGLVLAAFMVGVHVARSVVEATSDVPFCGWAPWFDCDAVLFHPRWGVWFGVPVAAAAVLVYAALTAALFALPRLNSENKRLWAWWLMRGLAIGIVLAAVWFIYLQVAVIGHFCSWCMAEHVVGLTLGVLIGVHGTGVPHIGPRGSAVAVGVVGAAVLAGGQQLYQPSYTRPLVGRMVGEDGYHEPTDSGRSLALADEKITLNLDAHPVLGSRDAEHIAVEAFDYTCPRCRRLHERFKEAKEQLGPDYAVLVLTFPLDAECNGYMRGTPERHQLACELARLGHAVWQIDAGRFARFHDWLFAHQETLQYKQAKDEAGRLVGAARLAGRLTDEKTDRLVRRDVEIAHRLGMQRLPGFWAGGRSFHTIPETAEALAQRLRFAFGTEPTEPSAPSEPDE